MRNLLPDRFHSSHDFCLYLHDRLVDLIVYGEKHEIFDTRFEFKDESEVKEFESSEVVDIFEWLEKKNRGEVIGDILLKRIFPAILSDFCQFIYEALSCSHKAKLVVAYALLRKPLREDLLYLEWLLADPEGLLNTFYNKESNELSFRHIGNPDDLKKIIKGALDRTANLDTFQHEYLYQIRFNKACPYGFEFFWNQALHLVTTKDPIATEKQNFNFIFSGEEDRIVQWKYMYGNLPYLLFYAVEICESLITMLMKEPMPDFARTSLHRSIGFILYSTEVGKVYGNPEYKNPGLEEFMRDCPYCGNQMPPDVERLRRLFDCKKIKCPSCRKQLSYEDFIDADDI